MKKTQTHKRNTNIPPKTHQNTHTQTNTQLIKHINKSTYKPTRLQKHKQTIHTHTQTHWPLPYCSSSYKTYSITRSRSRSQEARHISE